MVQARLGHKEGGFAYSFDRGVLGTPLTPRLRLHAAAPYDLVTAFNVMAHTRRDEMVAMYAQIHALTRPGGLFAVYGEMFPVGVTRDSRDPKTWVPFEQIYGRDQKCMHGEAWGAYLFLTGRYEYEEMACARTNNNAPNAWQTRNGLPTFPRESLYGWRTDGNGGFLERTWAGDQPGANHPQSEPWKLSDPWDPGPLGPWTPVGSAGGRDWPLAISWYARRAAAGGQMAGGEEACTPRTAAAGTWAEPRGRWHVGHSDLTSTYGVKCTSVLRRKLASELKAGLPPLEEQLHGLLERLRTPGWSSCFEAPLQDAEDVRTLPESARAVSGEF
jgi:hypothetical protein